MKGHDMKIKPILAFRAAVAGDPWPKTFTTEDEFAVDSEVARIALTLGRLSEKDADLVRKAQEAEEKAKAKAKADAKAEGAAPENKAGGAKD